MKTRTSSSLQRSDLSLLERDGSLVSRVLVSDTKSLIHRTGEFDVRKALGKFRPMLAEAMTAGFLMGWRREASLAGSRGTLELDFGSTIDKLAKLTPVNVAKLQAKFQTRALQITDDLTSELEARARKLVAELHHKGAHVKQGALELSRLLDLEQHQLETIFRTQAAFAYGAGKWQADHGKALKGVIWGYRYDATDDNRVRPNHWAAEGVTLPIDDDFWMTMWPPNGWRCRCICIPLTKPYPLVYPSQEAFADPGFGFNLGAELAVLD